jgi:hypothetical protein
MASGPVCRANRPNTWLHRPACDVKILLANSEPSTHGTKRTSHDVRADVGFWEKCGQQILNASSSHFDP